MSISFLTTDEVLELHADQIAAFGGSAGVRDFGLLHSAVAMPQSGFGGTFAHEFPHEMAAAYLFHVAANHPFVDGNKRTGLAAALLFLEVNDHTLAADKTAVGDYGIGGGGGETGQAGGRGVLQGPRPPGLMISRPR